VPVFSDKPPIDQGEGLPSKKEVAFYKISVQFEFVGDYISYTNFRRDLAQQKKIINIEHEKITVRTGKDESGGIVDIATTLSTYRFPASDADRFITGG
jgi:Tfp pilus assembly protein PilO